MQVNADEVIEAFGSAADFGERKRLFAEMFTAAEIRDLALRWEILKLLEAGMPQRRISARLGVSLCKITRGARVLRERGCVARGFLARRRGQAIRGTPARETGRRAR